MQLLETIASLKQEREALSEAIITLERLAANASGQHRRGRPPAWMSAAKTGTTATRTEKKTERTGRTFSAAQRKEQGAKMKKYWAEKKKAATAKVKSKSKSKSKETGPRSKTVKMDEAVATTATA